MFNPTRGMPNLEGRLVMGKIAFGGATGGYLGWRHSEGEEDRGGAVASSAFMEAALSAGTMGFGMAAWHYAKKNRSKLPALGQKAMDYATSSSQRYSANLGREFDQAKGAAKLLPFARRKLPMAGLGALVGGVIGDQYDHPVAGAAIGAGAGMAAAQGVRSAQVIKRFMNHPLIKHIPAKGMMLSVLASAGIFAGTTAMRDPEYAEQAEAESDGLGSYGYAAPGSGAGRRSRSMNSEGDLAFGLHNKRHG